MNNKMSMGYSLAVVATIIWAGNFIVARALNQDILPVGLAFWRWAIAVATLAPFTVRAAVADWKLIKKYLPYLTVSALSGVTTFNRPLAKFILIKFCNRQDACSTRKNVF
ncbi:EamA family transporter, partial [Microcoleus sp. N9_A1]